MGVALAAEAARRGATVTLVAANLAVPAPDGVELIEVDDAAKLADAVLGREAEIVIMSAAVADYRPVDPKKSKRHKSDENWTVELEPTTDVLQELGRRRRKGQTLVGFAADEGSAGMKRAREKLQSKKADLIVFNDISQPGIGFDSDENAVVLISEGSQVVLTTAPKSEIAAGVLDEVEHLRGISG
jgi:phosphopantothenoylcysteine decarboxylase/phosphopantothenate--cysteine ligase